MVDTPVYLQPRAHHRQVRERLIVRDADDRWYLWRGDEDIPDLEEVPVPLVMWLESQPDIVSLSALGSWVHVDDLPVSPTSATGRRW